MSKILRGFVWEKVAGWQGLLSSNCCQILYLNATDPTLDNSTYFFPLFSFLVFTKCQILNLRVGRPRNQVLQWAHHFLFRVWLNFCPTSFRRIHHCLAIVSEVSQWLSCTEQPKQSVFFISCESKKQNKSQTGVFSEWCWSCCHGNQRTVQSSI